MMRASLSRNKRGGGKGCNASVLIELSAALDRQQEEERWIRQARDPPPFGPDHRLLRRFEPTAESTVASARDRAIGGGVFNVREQR